MQDVSKFVTDRLRAAVPVANHPDADVLTAFSEHSLPERERAVVLEHLAVCGDCREILVLSQPAAEAEQMTLQPASRGWLSWPALRWGFVALGVFAIASLGVMQYRKHSLRPSSMASFLRQEGPPKETKNQIPYAAAAPQSLGDADTAKIPVSADSASAVRAQLGARSREFEQAQSNGRRPASGAVARKAVRASSPGSMEGASPLGHGARQSENNALNAQPAPAAYAKHSWIDVGSAASAQKVEVQSQNAQLQTQDKNPQALDLESERMPLQPTEGGQGHTVERAKEPGIVVGAGRSKVPVSSPQPSGVYSGSLSQHNASWTIADGSLRRSVDQGKTWQNVDVNAAPAAATNSTLAVQAVPASTAATKKDSSLKEAVPPLFRAVVANGPDVWAGGSRGLLCHSVDSGAHWILILPSTGGAILTGDIVGVDFPDSQHGRIRTSTPEVWLTSDGGQTWQKQ